jgi:hypothetical protein
MRFRGSSNIATTFERILGIFRDEAAPANELNATVRLEKFRGKAPPNFHPAMTIALMDSIDAKGNPGVRWETHPLTEDLQSWKEFRDGAHTTIAAFVEAQNKANDTQRDPGNFQRDYLRPWRKAGITEEQIRQAKQDMKDRKEGPPRDAQGNPIPSPF